MKNPYLGGIKYLLFRHRKLWMHRLDYDQRRTFDQVRPSFLVAMDEFYAGGEGTMMCVEVGSELGKNAETMLKMAHDRMFLICVECKVTPELVAVEKRWPRHMNIYRGLSVPAASRFVDETYDYIYIDAAHDYKNVWADINAWYPKLRVDGVMAGHDWWFDDVHSAVMDFTRIHPQFLYAVEARYRGVPIPSRHAQFMDWWFVKQEGRHGTA